MARIGHGLSVIRTGEEMAKVGRNSLTQGREIGKGEMEIMVAQADFECTYSGVRCTHVCASFHVWRIRIRRLILEQCNDA
jgi:hypothetical protein